MTRDYKIERAVVEASSQRPSAAVRLCTDRRVADALAVGRLTERLFSLTKRCTTYVADPMASGRFAFCGGRVSFPTGEQMITAIGWEPASSGVRASASRSVCKFPGGRGWDPPAAQGASRANVIPLRNTMDGRMRTWGLRLNAFSAHAVMRVCRLCYSRAVLGAPRQ